PWVQAFHFHDTGGIELNPVAGRSAAHNTVAGGGAAASKIGSPVGDVPFSILRDQQIRRDPEVLPCIRTAQRGKGTVGIRESQLDSGEVFSVIAKPDF